MSPSKIISGKKHNSTGGKVRSRIFSPDGNGILHFTVNPGKERYSVQPVIVWIDKPILKLLKKKNETKLTSF